MHKKLINLSQHRRYHFSIEGNQVDTGDVYVTGRRDARPPHEIAQQASEETNPDKIAELAEELIRSLDHQSRERMKQVELAKVFRKEAA